MILLGAIMKKKQTELEDIKKRFLSLMSNSVFKLLLIFSMLLSLFILFFFKELTNYINVIAIVGIFLGSIFFFIGVFYEKHFMKLLHFQLLALESVTDDLNKLIKLSENRTLKVKEVALSLTYLINLKKKNYVTKVILLVCGLIFGVLDHYYPLWDLLNFSIVLIVTLGFITIKESLVEFRIKKGWFGSNKAEAKTLIEFLITNSEDIDFTDSDGKLKRTLFPDSMSQKNETTATEEGVTV